MSIKKTYQIGTKVIRSRANEVRIFNNPEIKKVIRDLIDSMRHNNLVGMAAPQIGKGLRIFVSEIRKTKFRKAVKEDGLRVLINPRIVKKSKRQVVGFEGCGSVAEARLFGQVKRSANVEISAFSVKGQPFKLKTGGLLARIVQHEIDHLNGVVFIDHIVDTHTLLDRETYIRSQRK